MTSSPVIPPDKTLGLIGLGLLGSALAERALAAGYAVMGYDIAPACVNNLQGLGGTVARSPTEVAQRCTRILLALPHEGISAEVLDSLSQSLSPGTIILDATTGDADFAIERAATLDQQQVHYLDATVSGSSVQVRQGEALLMVGGNAAAFEACRDLFAAFAKETIHTGPCGSGAKMKLVTNLVLGLNRAALAEGLVFAEALGLSPAQALTILRASMAYSKAMDTKGEKMLSGDFSVQARLHKDVGLILRAAERAGQTLPLSERHQELLAFAESQGLGSLDNSAVMRAIQLLPSRESAS